MKTNFLIFLGAVFVTLTVNFTSVNAQSYLGMVYEGSGDWTDITNWKEGDGTGNYTNVYRLPEPHEDIYILPESSVICRAATTCGKALNVFGSLTTSEGAQLTVNGTLTISGTLTLGTTLNCYSNVRINVGGRLVSVQPSVYQTVFIGGGGAYNNSLTITNNGQLQNVNITMIPDAIRLTLTGTGVTTLNQLGIHANISNRDLQIVVDQNLFIRQSISVSRWSANFHRTLTINAGKTVKLGSGAYLHLDPLAGGSPTDWASGGDDYTYNINGTLDASEGALNLCTNSNTIRNEANPDQFFEFNVGPEGVVIVGEIVRKHVGKAGTTLSVNVAEGGSIVYEGTSYTTEQCALGALNNTAFSSKEVINSLLTPDHYNLKFNYGAALSGDGPILVKGNYTQGGNLTGKPLTMAGDSQQAISTEGTSISALIIDKPDHATSNTDNKVVLSTPLSIAGALTLTKRNLHLEDSDLTITAEGSISEGSPASHIVTNGAGALSQTVTSAGTTFPIGLSTDSYDPVRIKPTSTNVFAAKVYATPTGAPKEGVAYNRAEWDITSTATTNTELTFTPFEAYEKEPYPVIGHYVGEAWVDVAATLDGDSYTATFNSFSPFATGSSRTPNNLDPVAYSLTSWNVTDRQLIVNGLNANDIVSVYNLCGQPVATVMATANYASLRFDNAGVYIARIKSNNTTNTFKFVVE
jgi:hypothetical protein